MQHHCAIGSLRGAGSHNGLFRWTLAKLQVNASGECGTYIQLIHTYLKCIKSDKQSLTSFLSFPFTMDLARYIEGLSGTMMDELYQSQYVCQAILRCLPPLAKQYLFRLLHCPGVPAGQSSLLLALPSVLVISN